MTMVSFLSVGREHNRLECDLPLMRWRSRLAVRWMGLPVAVTVMLALAAMTLSAAESPAEAKYAKTLAPAEAMISAWDFAGAKAALSKVSFKEKDLTGRLAVRRDEVARLAKLKATMIERANTRKPWLFKATIGTTPVGLQITQADDKQVTVVKAGAAGKTSSTQTWAKLDKMVFSGLVKSVLADGKADDHLVLGILSLVLRQPKTAEKYFDKARSLGAKVQGYMGPLAAAMLAKAEQLVAAKQFAKAKAVLATLDEKYGSVPWVVSQNERMAAVTAAAMSGQTNAEAEKLYARAAKLFNENDLFTLRPIVVKLQAEFPDSRGVTDAKRKPSFAKLAEAVKNLGVLITVRQDGKGDFKTLREAVISAPPKSMIEIQDSGTYCPGEITLKSTTLRGAKGQWPILREGKPNGYLRIKLRGEGSGLEGLVFLACHAGFGIEVGGEVHRCSLRRLIVKSYVGYSWLKIGRDTQGTLLDGCLIVENLRSSLSGDKRAGQVTMRNCMWLNGEPESSNLSIRFENCLLPSFKAGAPAEFDRCTVLGNLTFPNTGGSVLNSIIGRITVTGAEVKIGFCNLVNKKATAGSAKPDKTCFSVDPKFRNPANFDYRLKPSSLCRRKGEGGKGVGCTYTPEMIQILRKALELRRNRLIRF